MSDAIFTDPDDPNAGSSQTPFRDDDQPAREDRLGCLRCGARIAPRGVVELRTGGSTGATHFFLGEWAELGEGKLPVEIYSCSRCGHLELRTAR
jgi:hypothetical protein